MAIAASVRGLRASNKFEDDEVAEIETALNTAGRYEGGGEALAGFKVEIAEEEPSDEMGEFRKAALNRGQP